VRQPHAGQLGGSMVRAKYTPFGNEDVTVFSFGDGVEPLAGYVSGHEMCCVARRFH
jgi:hypothetical protein